MGLDLRWPIGIMFFVLGLLLLGTGVCTPMDAALKARLHDVNINAVWGGFLVVFGAAMMVTAWASGRKQPAK